ncbi:MAG: DegT/DnrJ/EryC1/StrS aminotransferase family protein [Acutalibacteraceae bacterium]|nr:DegT/DnrJ/EryC1/StrS aminotransferase family protein [Clostridia bacterium]MEE3449655.1 DegT/DnrJ/EryC1/StrS aminotransferase family protein [Acutalibacteraceae bacterium]
MKIPFSPPDIGQAEIDAVVETMKSSWITTGPKTEELSQKTAQLCHVPYAACMNSATACHEMAMRLLGIGKGDEVIVPAYTYTASASVIEHVGAVPVIVDVEPGTYHISYEAAEKAITSRTKAIVPVDLGGVMCDYDRLMNISESKKGIFEPKNDLQKAIGRIPIVADGAHSFMAERADGKRSGELADFTSFSFHAVKNFTTAEGGALAFKPIEGIDGKALKKQLALLACHGQDRAFKPEGEKPFWEYDIVYTGYKHNMTDILASIGLVQLSRTEEILSKRRSIVKRYDEAFSDIYGVETIDHFTSLGSSMHLYMVRFVEKDEAFRNRFMDRMLEKGVSTNVHYKPLPLHTAYKNLGFDIKDYPQAYNMYKNEVTLPLYSLLTDEQVEYIIKTFKETCSEML